MYTTAIVMARELYRSEATKKHPYIKNVSSFFRDGDVVQMDVINQLAEKFDDIHRDTNWEDKDYETEIVKFLDKNL
jgi:hypothetical protein